MHSITQPQANLLTPKQPIKLTDSGAAVDYGHQDGEENGAPRHPQHRRPPGFLAHVADARNGLMEGG